MPFRLFQYPLPASPELEDLNAFLASHRVAAVTQHLVPTPGGGMLVFIVETAGSAASKPATPGGPKVDYREQLEPDDFARFNRLRDERKKWAEAEGLPVYTVFTNAQLASMARGKMNTLADLAQIEGLGAARLEKYGARLLTLLGTPPPAPREATP
jgi:superfamily II DNA helicase RecQ